MTWFQLIHHEALRCARHFKKAEVDLLDALQRVDAKRVFRKLGYASLFDYAVKGLRLSNDQAYNFIRVARKSIEFPEIKRAISQGEITVTQAKKISSVMTKGNQKEWIKKAATLPQSELEKQVAFVNPKENVPEKMKWISPEVIHFQAPISPKLMNQLNRAKEVLSQRKQKACSLAEVLEEMTCLFLKKNDPVEKGKRNLKNDKLVCRPVSPGKKHMPAQIRHAVMVRDKGKCQQPGCGQSRWVELHHLQPVSKGGPHSVQNLKTLCFQHHRAIHDKASDTVFTWGRRIS